MNIHPGRNKDGPFAIMDIVSGAGADPRRVIMCHIDVRLRRSDDRRRLAESGCCLGYDAFGGEGHFPSYWIADEFMDILNDTQRIYEIRDLIAAGFLDQILISQDIFRKSTRACYGRWGYAHILTYVVPMMRQRGITQEQTDTILVENPRRMFCFA